MLFNFFMIKEYLRNFTHEDRVRCRISSNKGKIEGFLVQYEILYEDEWRVVVRFDTYHGTMHRDMISWDATIHKEWFPQMKFDEGLNFSYIDIVNNWEKYRIWYCSKLDLI